MMEKECCEVGVKSLDAKNRMKWRCCAKSLKCCAKSVAPSQREYL